MPKETIETKDNLAVALTAAVVAREALDFINPSSTATLLKLKYKALMESVNRLREQLKTILEE
jgi:hypothetical protein